MWGYLSSIFDMISVLRNIWYVVFFHKVDIFLHVWFDSRIGKPHYEEAIRSNIWRNFQNNWLKTHCRSKHWSNPCLDKVTWGHFCFKLFRQILWLIIWKFKVCIVTEYMFCPPTPMSEKTPVINCYKQCAKDAYAKEYRVFLWSRAF